MTFTWGSCWFVLYCHVTKRITSFEADWTVSCSTSKAPIGRLEPGSRRGTKSQRTTTISFGTTTTRRERSEANSMDSLSIWEVWRIDYFLIFDGLLTDVHFCRVMQNFCSKRRFLHTCDWRFLRSYLHRCIIRCETKLVGNFSATWSSRDTWHCVQRVHDCACFQLTPPTCNSWRHRMTHSDCRIVECAAPSHVNITRPPTYGRMDSGQWYCSLNSFRWTSFLSLIIWW